MFLTFFKLFAYLGSCLPQTLVVLRFCKLFDENVRADAVARARERTGARAYAPTHDIPTTLSALTYDSTYDIICESIL